MKDRFAHAEQQNTPATASFARVDSVVGTNQSTVVIQCPSCQTKFALEGSRLAGIDNPRFHCSRCDNVFNCDHVVNAEEKIVANPVVNEPKPSTSAAITSVFDGFEPESFTQQASSMLQPSFSGTESASVIQSNSFLIPKQLDKDYHPEAPIERNVGDSLRAQIEKEVVSSSDREVSQIEFLFGDSAPPTSPTITPRASQPDLTEPQSTTASPVASSIEPLAKTEPTSKSVFDIFEEIAKERELRASAANESGKLCEIISPEETENDTSPRRKRYSTSGASLLSPSEKSASSKLIKEFAIPATPVQTSLADAPKRKPPLTHWQSVSYLSTGIAVAVGLFALLSYILVSSPSLAHAFVAIAAPKAPIAAPAGLMISETKLNRIDLDNGERISVISGKLINNSEQKFKDILIDGIVFNDADEELARVQTKASSPLSATRLKSLSSEMIQTLQTKSAHRKFELQAGGSAPFSIAVLDPKAQAASSFAARIYSVQE